MDHIKSLLITLLIGVAIGAGFVIINQRGEIATLQQEKAELVVKLSEKKTIVTERVIERSKPDGTKEKITEKEDVKSVVVIDSHEKSEKTTTSYKAQYSVTVRYDTQKRMSGDFGLRLGGTNFWAVFGAEFELHDPTVDPSAHIGVRVEW